MKTVLTKIDNFNTERLLYTEWLITNGLGGFACGNIALTPMRKYHSLLSAALPNPYGRTIMLNYIADTLILPDKTEIKLSSLKHHRQDSLESATPVEFRLENGLPVWIYDIKGVVLERSLLLINQQNTLHCSYILKTKQEGISLKWRPFFHFRTNEQEVDASILDEAYAIHATNSHYEVICPGFPALKLLNTAHSPFHIEQEKQESVYYEIEEQRGYAHYGALTSPGYYLTPLAPKERITFVASTESWQIIEALTPYDAWLTENMRKIGLLKAANIKDKNSLHATLTLAADQFLIKPSTRFKDMIRLQASGEEIKSVIAGFPWFTDWGRDTMISLEGLTLTTGRFREAYAILHTFAHYVHEGLIPNMFPDGANQGIYNTADATLWFFHAIDRYIAITGDREILDFLLPKLENIIHHHLKGTLFGIRADEDGLLIQGHPGVQLTWMDAKVGDWVVTPRRGKAVEINALWYNALSLFEEWSGKSIGHRERCFQSFNEKFWFEEGDYLYDVIEGEEGKDSALRPNQIFAISLKYPVLQENRWNKVLQAVKSHLFTPVGLRTLTPTHKHYKSLYEGDLISRDAAYHQGSVWPWLLGPYIDAWLKVHPDDFETPRTILHGLEEHVHNICLGTIGEIFDASEPFQARGCFAQAWSVAEVLRCINLLSSGK